MDPMHRAKQDYEKINIPNDLDRLVDESISQGRSLNKKVAMNKGLKIALGSFAGIFMVMLCLPAFASVAEDIPVFGSIFKSWHIESNETGAYIDASVPFLAEETEEETAAANEEIYSIIDGHIKELRAKADNTFNTEGSMTKEGIPESSIVDSYSLYADYEIMYQSEEAVSFVIYVENVDASVEHFNYYYTSDLNTKDEVTLMDLIEQNEISIDLINTEIKNQIEIKEAADENNLYFHDEDEFTTISEDQSFYINDQSQLVIVFDRYEIAPGYMGEQEFIIPVVVTLP